MGNEEELVESPIPGKRDSDSTTIDENNDTINRHELELSLLRDEIDKFRVDMDKYIPMNCIVMYAGTEADVPDLWHICNGQGGTVDLRDKFVRGGAYDDIGDEGGFKDIEQTLPEHTHQLDHHFHVIDAHRHTISETHTHTINAHSHTQQSHTHSFSVGSHVHSVGSHVHGMSHGHGNTDDVTSHFHVWPTIGTGAYDYVLAWDKSGAGIRSGFGSGHIHHIPNYSGSTGEGGGGSTGEGGGGGGSTGGANPTTNTTSLTTNSDKTDRTDELGEVNTQTAGDGDTYPAGTDISGAGKNLPPYYSLAFIQKVK